MSGWASPAVNSWTSDPQLRFRFCFVDDLTYAPKQPHHMPAPPPRPSSVPPRPAPSAYQPSDHLRYLVSSPRTTRGEVERRLHLLQQALPKTKGEARAQTMGDIAFLQCVLEKFANGFAPPMVDSLGLSPPKSPRFKNLIPHRHHKDKGGLASGATTPRSTSPVPPVPSEPRDVSCCTGRVAA